MTESSTKATPRPLDYEDDIDQMMADELDAKAEYHYTPKFTQSQMDALLAERDQLLAALNAYIKFSDEAALLIDEDKEVKALKLLLAMAGRAPKYRADVDAARAATALREGE